MGRMEKGDAEDIHSEDGMSRDSVISQPARRDRSHDAPHGIKLKISPKRRQPASQRASDSATLLTRLIHLLHRCLVLVLVTHPPKNRRHNTDPAEALVSDSDSANMKLVRCVGRGAVGQGSREGERR